MQYFGSANVPVHDNTPPPPKLFHTNKYSISYYLADFLGWFMIGI